MRVLVVDDEPDLAELVSFEFEILGAQVKTVDNGKKALDLIQQGEAFDVIISDVRMPHMDGIVMLESIRKIHPFIPAIYFMTGYADLSLEEVYDLGASAIFGKPFNRNNLIQTILSSMLPKEKRWRQKPFEEPCIPIKGSFESFDDAAHKHQLAFGHGGFYVFMEEKFPGVSSKINFEFSFSKDPIMPLVSGHGIVRWVRGRKENKDLPGIGVEIIDVSDDGLKALIQKIEGSNTTSYIPKG